MPDFFDQKPADISWYPPDTEEKGKKLGEFFNVNLKKGEFSKSLADQDPRLPPHHQRPLSASQRCSTRSSPSTQLSRSGV